ncbi:G patch domain-containing protein 1 isoform X2 [Xiphophorus couchianus]|uniref:G patch domain-containing protein 1 isoform X2 n=1 Tax=Xiphophorus couchianus TaxID=32473 RepID=UPI001016889D|nr:G patch domain-containing protein 1-like isoform X2 [Xiphophorus couchianus]
MAADSEEDFVSFGTPLEPLEEDEPLKKPVPLHEQTVKDEKGRYQRFHGAFTGGFSAGYFNTVGSKEGWTPSTFVSSRQQKAEKHHARPEDFMDEEDFGEHGIAPREITTSQEFSSSRRDPAAEKARAVGAQAALIPGDSLLEELIAPARSSVGVELLTRMGWKEGQGIGPRLKRKPRRQLPVTAGVCKTYSCALPPAGSEESEEDDEEFAPEDVTFAPKDVTPVDFSPRLGVQGLGYRGLDPCLALPGQDADRHVHLFRPQSETRSRLFGDRPGGSKRGGVAGQVGFNPPQALTGGHLAGVHLTFDPQAFGVGALEDEDEDVYHRDSMSRYDTVLKDEEPGDGLYGWTAPQQYTRRADRSRDAAYLGKILDGFTLAQKPLEQKTVFPPPNLPRDYRPVHFFRPPVNVSRLCGVSPALAEALRSSRGHMVKEEAQQGGRHQLDSGQRGALLGEDALQGSGSEPGSVMDLLRPEDRQRLLNLRTATAQRPSQAPPPGPAPPLSGLQQEALAAWRGSSSSSSSSSQSFKPFENTPGKQVRYERYLSRLQQGDAGALEQSLDPAMTEWERGREREEFLRASILYRPSSSSLSTRFTRAQQPDAEDAGRDQQGDSQQAASGTFGKLTRETLEWHPDRLLCKRFNVPDPYPGSALVGLPKVKRDKFSVFDFLTVSEHQEATAPPKPLEEKKSRWDVSKETGRTQNQAGSKPTGPAPDHCPSPPQGAPAEPHTAKEEEEEEEEERPSMDLFRAIFITSSEEQSSSSSEEDGDEDEEAKGDEEPVKLFGIASSPSSSRLAGPDLSSSVDFPSMPLALSSSSAQMPSREEEEEFGPKLPPPSAADATGGATASYQRSNRRSKEKKQKKKQQKHRKEKKKKKHRKHKAKQQKKSREEESSSSEDGEGVQPSTGDLLKRLKSIRTLNTW